MFTIKYRQWNPASDTAKRATPGSWVSNEQIWGPFEFVSAEYRDNGLEVYGYYKRYPISDDAQTPVVNSGLPMTFGPYVDPDKEGRPRPTLWVMNSDGATVAKYDL